MKQSLSPAVVVVIVVVVVILVGLIGWKVLAPKKGPGQADGPKGPDEVKAMMKAGGYDSAKGEAPKGKGGGGAGAGGGGSADTDDTDDE